MSYTTTRGTLLLGHDSPETAYVIADYPHGRALRCKKRIWIETATKGAKKGDRRSVYQTTNPRVGHEVWQNPHASQYSPLVFLYQEGDTGHIKTFHTGGLSVSPASDARFRLLDLYEQLPDADRRMYDAWLKLSQKYSPPWDQWAELVDGLARHLAATGDILPLVNSSVPGAYDRYVNESDYSTAVAWVQAHA
jgi:hypothetical protein